MRIFAAAFVALLLAGCQSNNIFDDIEDQAWDKVADQVSEYCGSPAQDVLWVQRTRIEVRREVRQRGSNGPAGPTIPVAGLDDKTANGEGPVLMIWCEGETNGQGVPFNVPYVVWENMIRDWED